MRSVGYLRRFFLSIAFTAVTTGTAVAGMTGSDVAASHVLYDPPTIDRIENFGADHIGPEGVTLTNPGNYVVHISDTQIIVDGFSAQSDRLRFSDMLFNGIDLSFRGPWQMPYFVINPLTNWSDFTADRIFVGGATVRLNFSDLDVTRETLLVLDITDTYPTPGSGLPGAGVSPVPELQTCSLLLAGLFLMGFVAQRRRRS